MGTLHDVRLGEGFLELPKSCARHLSNLELVGGAVTLCGANKAIGKTGVVLSLSFFFFNFIPTHCFVTQYPVISPGRQASCFICKSLLSPEQ